MARTATQLLILSRQPRITLKMPAAFSGLTAIQKKFIHSQDNVPRLPVPPLEQTLSKYLRYVKPILSKPDYVTVTRLVSDFRDSGVGAKLQTLLEQRAQNMENWLTDWWLNVAYLQCRDPAVISVNPGVRLPTQTFTNTDEWLSFTTKLVLAVVEYKKLLDAKSLPVDKLRDSDLCMSQYYAILNSCRIPRPVADVVVNFYEESSDHIVVVHRNQFYQVQVSTGKGSCLSFSDIKNQLHQIVNSVPRQTSPAVGLLSSQPRDFWASCYKKLESIPDNLKTLAAIQRSIFLLCLDEPIGNSNDDSTVCCNMLHGCGFAANSANRFFDKTLQIIVASDGGCGVNYEHAPAEGPPVIALLDYAFDYIQKNKNIELEQTIEVGTSTNNSKEPYSLNFISYPGVDNDIATASAELQTRIDNLELTAFCFTDFGKNFAKKSKLSPDALFQVALQLAYYRIYLKTTATYESGSIRKFKYGRTDTIRSCSLESLHFSQQFLAWLEGGCNINDVVTALRNACTAHSAYTAAVVDGKGIDRHLLGLKLISKENGVPLHPLFTSPQHAEALHYRLSTSQVPTRINAALCFGPVVPDGYGVCYNPQNTAIHVVVTAYRDCPDTDAEKLAESLRLSLRDIRDMLEQDPTPKL